ncbi:MAG: hypothetical protein MI866_19080 [Bacteroidales bacterium]|nr:hypothetical protein [Bacteroidales bacterium]
MKFVRINYFIEIICSKPEKVEEYSQNKIFMREAIRLLCENIENAAEINFDDAFFYEELKRLPGQRKIETTQLLREEAGRAFKLWMGYEGKTTY